MTMQLHSILSSTYRHLTPLTVIIPILYLNYDLQIADESLRVSNGGVSGGEPVILNIYDMFWTNDYSGAVGLGVYHSGVEGRGIQYLIEIAIK